MDSRKPALRGGDGLVPAIRCFTEGIRGRGRPRSILESPVGPRLPKSFTRACINQDILPTRFVLVVRVVGQRIHLFEQAPKFTRLRQRDRVRASLFPLNRYGLDSAKAVRLGRYFYRKSYLTSTSMFGIGQIANSNRTPAGLHRVAEKIGGGQPIGTVFRSRKPVGLTWQGMPTAKIVHRILWLEGLEPGRNRGGRVDSHSRYIYIHGFGDETTLGRAVSLGCIHLAAADLLPLFDLIPVGTLVWIEA